MNTVANYHDLKEKIAAAALASGRRPEDITLVAVTKTHSWPEILPLYREGLRIFGESRLQEALPKMTAAPDDIQWHLIGTLQKNKVAKAVGAFSLIHSVDSLELAQKISLCSQEKNVNTSILLQVNCSGESSKHGFTAETCGQNFELLCSLPHLNIAGLMTMAAAGGTEKEIRHTFVSLRVLRDKLSLMHPLPHLSMGMSADYFWAIAEGATIVRVGSALFNQR